MAGGRPTWWRVAFAIVCGGWWLKKIVTAFPSNQWDFRVYYYAAQAWRGGLNPYDPSNLPPVAGTDVYPFVYPPYTLGFFALFTRLSLEQALLAFLLLKLALLVGLIWMWSRLLQTSSLDPAWVAFLLFGYASCLYVDFASGNVTVLEQALVWFGIGALFAERYWLFVAAIVVASLFKLTPILLLALSLAIPQRQPWKYAIGGAAAFGAVLLVTYLANRGLANEFIRAAASLDERGRINPSSWALVKDSAALVGRALGAPIPQFVQLGAYGIFVIAVVAATAVAARSLLTSLTPDRREWFVFLVVLAFALVQPRFKNYSYILALVPTFFVATRAAHLKRAVPLLILACIPAYSWITTTDNLALLANYTSWFILLGVWALALFEIQSRTPRTA